MSIQEKKKRGTRAVVARQSAAAALTLAVVLGSGVVGAPTASAINFIPYTTAEEDTWVPGQTQIPILKDFWKGTTFLDWARIGATQNVQVQNSTGQNAPTGTGATGTAATAQNIYVLQQTRLAFVFADMAAAAASLTINVASGNWTGLASEAAIRGALGDYQTCAWGLVKSANEKLTAYKTQSISELRIASDAKDAALSLGKCLSQLNGDAKTLWEGAEDLLARLPQNGSAATALQTGGMSGLNDLLFEKFKAEAVTIAPGETKSVRNDDYKISLAAFAGTNATFAQANKQAQQNKTTVGAKFINKLSGILGVLNVKGVSGWLSQLGFPTVGMYAIRADKFGTYMTTPGHISWVAYHDKIKPASSTLSGNIAPQEGIGHYTWRDLTTPRTSGNQTLFSSAFNALESSGWDAAGSSDAIKGILTSLKDFNKTATQADAAKLVLQPNFRKLLWMEYTANQSQPGYNSTPYASAGWAVRDASAKVPATNTTWKKSPASVISTLETAARDGLKAGGNAGGFTNGPPVWNQEASDMYDAVTSAVWYGPTFRHAQQVLQRMANNFNFGTTGVWASSVPDTTAGTASPYVQIAAAVLANAKGNLQEAFKTIDLLAITYGGTAGMSQSSTADLVSWWDKKQDYPWIGTTPYKIKLTSALNTSNDASYCLNAAPNGVWQLAATVGKIPITIPKLQNWYCDGDKNNNNTSERWYFTADGQLQAHHDEGDTGTMMCLHAASTTAIGGVNMMPCIRNDNMQWRKQADGTIRLYSGTTSSPGTDTGYCLTAENSKPTGDALLASADCIPNDATQVWTFTPYVTPFLRIIWVTPSADRKQVTFYVAYRCGNANSISYELTGPNGSAADGASAVVCDGALHTTVEKVFNAARTTWPAKDTTWKVKLNYNDGITTTLSESGTLI
ncbi:ricin-type beta-trefoil lectin domain protein [Streptomyces sp. NPDC005533]|uniref:ricin-type beta-trefoil lectin domain protein n=1 Tax=Streptomyces sp. NPDC005533 TaxID=3364723 RepID=UPI0036A71104